jgi:hypothetical protein
VERVRTLNLAVPEYKPVRATLFNLRVGPVKNNAKNLIRPLNNFIENRQEQIQVEVKTRAKVEVRASTG